MSRNCSLCNAEVGFFAQQDGYCIKCLDDCTDCSGKLKRIFNKNKFPIIFYLLFVSYVLISGYMLFKGDSAAAASVLGADGQSLRDPYEFLVLNVTSITFLVLIPMLINFLIRFYLFRSKVNLFVAICVFLVYSPLYGSMLLMFGKNSLLVLLGAVIAFGILRVDNIRLAPDDDSTDKRGGFANENSKSDETSGFDFKGFDFSQPRTNARSSDGFDYNDQAAQALLRIDSMASDAKEDVANHIKKHSNSGTK